MNLRGCKWTLARMLRLKHSDDELDEEIRAHLAIDAQQRMERGDSPETARIEAVNNFGNVALVKEVTREMWTFPSLERLWQDARYAVRGLTRSVGFTLLALTALALGIGSTTAMFTVLYSVVVRPLPFPDPDRLVTLWEKSPRNERPNVVSILNFRAWKERARSFELMAAYNQGPKNLLGSDGPIQIIGANVTGDFFRVLRVAPILGRGFASGEEGPSQPRLAVLSHGFWQRRFGGEASVIGQRVSIGGVHHEIIGVMPQDFAFPDRHVDAFTLTWPEYSGRDFYVVARLRPGVGLESARAEMTSIAAGTAAENPLMNAGYSATVIPLHEHTVGRIRPLMRVLFATVLLVLLIACANVANLLLMRAVGRDREMSVRLALGAGRWRLAQQLTVESLILTGAGGLLGTMTATWGLRVLLASLPADFPVPRAQEIVVDSTVLWFTTILCTIVGLFFGTLPVFLSGRRDLSETLRAGGRSIASHQRHFRRIMVITEVAVALVLVIGAGLMIRSLLRLHQVDLGFEPERVITVRMLLLPGKPTSQAQLIADILQRLRTVPQLVSASSISIPPMAGINSATWYYRADLPEPPRENRPGGDISIVMTDYFRTMGIAILMGRDFGTRDRFGGTHVGVLNRTAAQALFGSENPLGKRLTVSWNEAGQVEIVGVVADIRHRNPQSKPEPCLFLLNTQLPFPLASLVIRTSTDPRALISAIKSAIHKVAPDQGIATIETMEERIANAGAQSRVQAWLFTAFSLIAVALACIGIYGVISYSVSERTREIGVRVALGADRLRIFGQILRESMALAGAGVALGLLVSLALTRYLETLLFDIKPTDPAVYASVAILMLIVGAAASYVPSRRAATVDPVVALRDE
jgi:putative ABC transport system permease protein